MHNKYENQDIEEKYKVGDKVWWLSHGGGIYFVVHVVIKEITYGYWIDEPIGHAVYEDELYDNLEDALLFLKEKCFDHLQYESIPGCDLAIDLNDFRERSIRAIVGSYKANDENHDSVAHEKDLRSMYCEKIKGKDWFSADDVGYRRTVDKCGLEMIE